MFFNQRQKQEEELVSLLLKNNWKIATAESCTAGLISALIVNVSGASEVFEQGFVAYSNDAKVRNLRVSRKVLDEYGAVSQETAIEMAKGAAFVAGTEVAVSATGIAGPAGGTEDKPVGLTYIGCYIKGRVCVLKCEFKGNRMENRINTAKNALKLVIDQVKIAQYLED